MRKFAFIALLACFIASAAAAQVPPGDVISVGGFDSSMVRVDPGSGAQSFFPSFEIRIRGADAIDAAGDGSLVYIDEGRSVTELLRVDLQSGRVTTVRSPVECCGLGVDGLGRPLVFDEAGRLLRIDLEAGTETVLGDFSDWTRGDIAVATGGEIYLGLRDRFPTPVRVLLGFEPVSGRQRIIRDVTSLGIAAQDAQLLAGSSGEILVVPARGSYAGISRFDAASGDLLDVIAADLDVGGADLDPAGRLFAAAAPRDGLAGLYQIDPADGSAELVSTGLLVGVAPIAVTPGPLAECRDGVDNDRDGSVDFPADPGCEFSFEATELADSALDLCRADVQSCEEAVGEQEAELQECQGDLAAVRADLDAALADADGDGVPDSSDSCPGTLEIHVDALGCSLPQFCAGFDATTKAGRQGCKKADWRNDEPQGARDCRRSGSECAPR